MTVESIIVATYDEVPEENRTYFPRLERGVRYKLSWDDCCTSGFAFGTFLGYRLVPNRPGEAPTYPDTMVFVEGHEMDGVTAELAEEQTT